MKPSFAARRKPKAIARDPEEDDDPQAQSDTIASAVKRPNARSKHLSSKPTSFSAGASRTTSQNASDDEGEHFVLKKSTLSQQAIARNARRKAGIKLPDDNRLASIRRDDDRPSYSSEAIALLKESTPATPISTEGTEDEQQILRELDIASKFGADYVSRTGSAAIPTDAEIAEKKARRARLANELKYQATAGSESDEDQAMLDASHDSDDDEFRMQIDRVVLSDPRKSKYPETRFVRDDEDILEGFDEFTQTSSGGQVSIGRKAEKEAKKKARAEMKTMIEQAEGSDSDDSEDSERERRESYEALQTRKAIGTVQSSALPEDVVPPRLPAIPNLSSILDKIRSALEEVDLMRQAKQREIEEIEEEKREIQEREDDVQRALKETAEEYQRLSIEAGLKSAEGPSDGLDVEEALLLRDQTANPRQRGLEDLTGNGI